MEFSAPKRGFSLVVVCCLLVTLSEAACPSHWLKIDGFCYKTFTDQSFMNAYDAQSLCRDQGADMASFPDNATQFSVANQLASDATTYAYIGASDLNETDSFFWLDGSIFAPENFSGCPHGWHRLDNKCYGVTTKGVNYQTAHDAREDCFTRDADLLITYTPEEFLFVVNVVKANDSVNHERYKCKQTQVAMLGEPGGVGNCTVISPVGSTWDTNAAFEVVDCCSDVGVSALGCVKYIDECASNPCVNGTCTDNVLGFECTFINNCDSDPCQNGAECIHGAAYECTCVYGYTGVNCETLFDECISDPCQNNGTCIDGENSYNCTCLDGFTGTVCETNIDDCANVTCQNNATCRDGIETAYCDCLPGYTGDVCQTEITCSSSLVIGNATLTNSSRAGEFGGWLAFDCLPGHKFPDMLKSKNFSCTVNGYSPTVPERCELHCDSIPQIMNAVALNPNTIVGNTVNYTCNYGYQFPDNSTEYNLTCNSPGNWSEEVANISQCEIVRCPELMDYPHQELNTYNNTYDTTVTFWCDVGYVLHDNTTARTIKCLATGDWTATLPPCDPVRCPNVETSPYQKRNTTANTYNTYAKFECSNKRRMLDGSTYRTIKCDATAEWSANITDCSDQRCFPLPYVANATPSTTDTDFGVVSTLTCIRGHRFNPGKLRQKTMTCKGDGWWNPILTHCDPILCDAVPLSLNINPSTENQLFGTIVDYTCDKGHYIYPELSSGLSIECQENEQWNFTDIPSCWPIVCPDPALIENGTRTLPSPELYNYTALVLYDCDEGFKFIDGRTEKNIYCDELGAWNDTDVSCRIKKCPEVEIIQNATVNSTGILEYNTYIDYTCNIGYKYEDDETSKLRWCSDEAIWEPVDFPSCKIVLCPDLLDVENATRDSNATHYDTVVNYACDEGYQYPDKSTEQSIQCLANGSWTEYPPPCDVVFCPPVPQWDEADYNSTDNSFLAVVSYKCHTNFSFEDSKDLADGQNVEKISTCLEIKVWDPPFDDCVPLFSIDDGIKGKTWESPEGPSIATITCSIMGVVFGLMVLLDLNKIWMDLQMLRSNVGSFINSMKANKVSSSEVCLKDAVDSTP
ncbi:hypothetical protein CAPTEDRAFT_220964 [Capitella teleta]|uniref:Sushi, von Willebrand factor type A, EGF and pentraxin domain-containing protein 1 n=1 Tax=Capitella teleta TaxID=283909 RepID=R7VJM6_CAPTE|nr:hypothetical protein CAPTEDRAFT_220964 [Capitella teleta]|eukprot:ELU16611.1 hypothetical protein CAPTEDRAFT_220964 [Capitella teleta]